jgi:putative spermidine/putrescine transport system permease protein
VTITRIGPLLPATALVVLIIALPQLLMLRFSVNQYDAATLMREAFTLQNYAAVITDPFYQQVMLRTVTVAFLSTVICVVLGVPAAYLLSRAATPRLKTILLLCIIIPLFIGNAARSVGWIVVLSDRGAANGILISLGLVSEPIRMMNTTFGVVVSLVSILLPYMIIAVQSVLDGINKAVEEAALSLGADFQIMLRRILLPLAMPGVFAGIILTFVLGMGAYAAPVFIGGPSYQMMAPKIYEQILVANNWPMGAALSFILLGFTVLITVILTFALQRRYGKL